MMSPLCADSAHLHNMAEFAPSQAPKSRAGHLPADFPDGQLTQSGPSAPTTRAAPDYFPAHQAGIACRGDQKCGNFEIGHRGVLRIVRRQQGAKDEGRNKKPERQAGGTRTPRARIAAATLYEDDQPAQALHKIDRSEDAERWRLIGIDIGEQQRQIIGKMHSAGAAQARIRPRPRWCEVAMAGASSQPMISPIMPWVGTAVAARARPARNA